MVGCTIGSDLLSVCKMMILHPRSRQEPYTTHGVRNIIAVYTYDRCLRWRGKSLLGCMAYLNFASRMILGTT
jgi:hypothetical protein